MHQYRFRVEAIVRAQLDCATFRYEGIAHVRRPGRGRSVADYRVSDVIVDPLDRALCDRSFFLSIEQPFFRALCHHETQALQQADGTSAGLRIEDGSGHETDVNR